MSSTLRLFGAAIILLCGFFASAHEVRPAYLEIKEDSLHRVSILWKQPVMGEIGVRLVPRLSADWLSRLPDRVSSSNSFYIKQWFIDDKQHLLEKQEITIEGLEETITDVLVNVTLSDGRQMQHILNPQTTSFVIASDSFGSNHVLDYLYLGIEHILEGIDHLLFVLGLILLVKKRSVLIKTITAFTIAHSITLSAATLGLVKLSPPVVEVVIALSIIFVGLELVRSLNGTEGLTVRHPWFIAFSFGLLHGFGFAGALTEIGLPSGDIPLSLLLFNIGVEVGQLIFLSAILIIIALIKRSKITLPKWTYYIPPYAIGSFATAWFIERALNIL